MSWSNFAAIDMLGRLRGMNAAANHTRHAGERLGNHYDWH
jgi:hypothetical protein